MRNGFVPDRFTRHSKAAPSATSSASSPLSRLKAMPAPFALVRSASLLMALSGGMGASRSSFV